VGLEAVAVSGPLRADFESVREVIYATEFQPPGDGWIPIAFETRNTGSQIDVNRATPVDGGVSISVSNEVTSWADEADWTPDRDTTSVEAATRIPIFETQRTVAQAVLKFGVATLQDVRAQLRDDGSTMSDRRSLIFFTASALPATGDVVEPATGGTVTLLWVEFATDLLGSWLSEHAAATLGTGLWAPVELWLAEGTAEAVDIDILPVGQGSAAASQSSRELIYPTEYDPEYDPPAGAGSAMRPMAFETRNAGSQSEVTLRGTAELPFLEVSSALTTHDGDTVFHHVGDGDQRVPDVTQPVFVGTRVRTNIDLALLSGSPVVLGLGPAVRGAGEGAEPKSVVLFAKLTP
jgi:hypothetical protein